MAKPGAFHPCITLQALTVIPMLAVLAAIVAGQHHQCPPFSCGGLHNISYPFRLPGDPPECGVQLYELVCSSSKATIYINTGTYHVTSINYTDRSFWVVDANLDTNRSCTLPRWNHLSYSYEDCPIDSHGFCNLVTGSPVLACFVNCSRAITNNSRYKPVACLSANNSYVYAHTKHSNYFWPQDLDSNYFWPQVLDCYIEDLEPSCGCLAMIPFGSWHDPDLQLRNASYPDIIELVRKGFPVWFPSEIREPYYGSYEIIKLCLNNSISYFKEQISDASILNWTRAFFWSEIHFFECLNVYHSTSTSNMVARVMVYVIDIPRFLVALCRFVLAPLVVLTFLAHKYLKTRITIDAVEKFLRMQQMIGPTRYAYTDIVAITSNFRDKLGQGGYGSVYKGALLAGDVRVAVKMLEGNANCNGEDFINEVSTIGRIHHVNVVRLVGFCSEEMRRALVYEYMPRGSLDKSIFSSQKSFSWDKLNEIALGIARGINYLHQGCDMQILHFDIKPHNILLDSNFVPKVADFGLAKLYPRDNRFVPLSALRGTVGYIAPEMVSRSFGVISSKSDVYSFGMLLLEMAGGRRNADPDAANSSQAYYPSWVYDRLTQQQVGEISAAAAEMHELERKLCLVGLCCIQMKPHDRPTMSEVIEMIEGDSHGLQVPSRPFFCDDEHNPEADSFPLFSELSTISEEVE